MRLTRQSDGKEFNDLWEVMEDNAKQQEKCKHFTVSARCVITGEPYPRNVRAVVRLWCDRCHAVLYTSRTERVPASLLKGKRFNRQK